MKIKNKVVLAGLLLSLSLTSCNNMSENKNTADDNKNETEVTESADSKETEEKADGKEAEEKDNKDADKSDKADKSDSKEEKTDDKEASDKEETADNEKAEDQEAKEDKTDAEGAQTKEEAIAELEQSIFDSRVTMRALEILQTEAPEAIEGREDEIQALIDHSNEVIESAREILDQVQNN